MGNTNWSGQVIKNKIMGMKVVDGELCLERVRGRSGVSVVKVHL